jgi:HD superfamily phosphohydrolase
MPLPYDDVHLIADPLYGYLRITTPLHEGEITETQIIDNPWVQRLKRIHQLQSSWWVFPTAEHSRFAHCLGVMHLAGALAKHVYPSLVEVLEGEGALPAPSRPLVEETLRMAGLLHDVGHGPFSHFCDEHYLHPRWGLDHEQLGQHLIVNDLGAALAALTRSPGGAFSPGERVDPRHVAYLIRDQAGRADAGHDPSVDDEAVPRWVRLLRRALSGAVTVDNMDYVRRDAYMCGVSLGAVDVDRLIYYTFCTEVGLTYHKRALGALRAFLNARFYMYENVYFHRVGGAIDLHLREIFADTMALVLPRNPLEDLASYRKLTEWSLFEQVEGWLEEPPNSRRHRLGQEWQQIIHRNVKYHVVFEQSVERRQIAPATRELAAPELEAAIRRLLPARLEKIPFKVDVASQDPRPLNPLRGSKRLPVFDPVTGKLEDDLLAGIVDFIPAKAHIYRVYAADRQHERELAEAARAALGEVAPSSLTNL